MTNHWNVSTNKCDNIETILSINDKHHISLDNIVGQSRYLTTSIKYIFNLTLQKTYNLFHKTDNTITKPICPRRLDQLYSDA